VHRREEEACPLFAGRSDSEQSCQSIVVGGTLGQCSIER
jgi:hypothetical protein